VNGDGTVEPNETLSIVLSNPVNVTVTPGGGLGTLYNDDGVTDVEGDRAGALALRLLTPNPGGASARLEFELPDAARITLSVLDVHGHRVALLADGVFAAGRHGAVWEAGSGARRIPRGVYFARLATPAGIRTQRIVLL
jgi:hypothetical protein